MIYFTNQFLLIINILRCCLEVYGSPERGSEKILYKIKIPPSLKNTAKINSANIQIAIREILEILFLLGHPENFLDFFLEILLKGSLWRF